MAVLVKEIRAAGAGSSAQSSAAANAAPLVWEGVKVAAALTPLVPQAHRAGDDDGHGGDCPDPPKLDEVGVDPARNAGLGQ